MFCLVTDLHDWQAHPYPRWPPRTSGGGTIETALREAKSAIRGAALHGPILVARRI